MFLHNPKGWEIAPKQGRMREVGVVIGGGAECDHVTALPQFALRRANVSLKVKPGLWAVVLLWVKSGDFHTVAVVNVDRIESSKQMARS